MSMLLELVTLNLTFYSIRVIVVSTSPEYWHFKEYEKFCKLMYFLNSSW